MTDFKPIPRDLYRHVEPEAGTVRPALTGRLRPRRPVDEFDPDWGYVLAGRASKQAVVAALCCGSADVPERVWPAVLRLYCPQAWALLAEAQVSFDEWNTGRTDAVLSSEVAATANSELDGYAVFASLDVPVAVAEVVAGLGQVPKFV